MLSAMFGPPFVMAMMERQCGISLVFAGSLPSSQAQHVYFLLVISSKPVCMYTILIIYIYIMTIMPLQFYFILSLFYSLSYLENPNKIHIFPKY